MMMEIMAENGTNVLHPEVVLSGRTRRGTPVREKARLADANLALLERKSPSERLLLRVTVRSGRGSRGRRRGGLAGAGAKAQSHRGERDHCDIFHNK